MKTPKKCRRCGRCCYVKYRLDGKVFNTRMACPHLDVHTHLCRVYARRRQMNPECGSVAKGIKAGVFPADCPYVADQAGYRPPVKGRLCAALVARIESGELATARAVLKAMKVRPRVSA